MVTRCRSRSAGNIARSSAPWHFALVALTSALVWTTFALGAAGFPGVCIGKDAVPRFVHATQVVVMRSLATTSVTIMVDYEGPLAPFALLFPVPSDVVARDVKTVRRGVLKRLEQLSAPRFHAFYEQDPCETGTLEQDWEPRIHANGRGILTPPELPGPQGRYAVSNLISAPIEPTFKGAENEFSYVMVEPESPTELRRVLEARGYVVSALALSALEPHVGPSKRLLLAEVSLEHVEILGANRAQLGGVRYVTRRPHTTLPLRLGRINARAEQELLLYVLDSKQRYVAANYENIFLPTNVVVSPESARDLRRVHNALFDRTRAGRPPAFVTEYAWSTAGCGEPCPDAPLGLDELMTLGGDAAEGPPRAAAKPRKDPRAELARRTALLARHRYVLSRLHHRYDAEQLPRDLELVGAPSIAGGTGVPRGPSGALARSAVPSAENALQTRYVSLHSWRGAVTCLEPLRFRWGKRWPSEARAARAVPLALDLFERPVVPPVPPPLAPSAEPSAKISAPEAPQQKGSCALCWRTPPELGFGAAYYLCLAGWAARRALRARRERSSHLPSRRSAKTPRSDLRYCAAEIDEVARKFR